jgi:hypothetical protein
MGYISNPASPALPAGVEVGPEGEMIFKNSKMAFYGVTPPSARPAAYTQTYSATTRVHAKTALSESVVIALLTDVPGLVNTTNAAVNELKKLVNQVIDDLQSEGLLQ